MCNVMAETTFTCKKSGTLDVIGMLDLDGEGRFCCISQKRLVSTSLGFEISCLLPCQYRFIFILSCTSWLRWRIDHNDGIA
jgi:hypothetical protein